MSLLENTDGQVENLGIMTFCDFPTSIKKEKAPKVTAKCSGRHSFGFTRVDEV